MQRRAWNGLEWTRRRDGRAAPCPGRRPVLLGRTCPGCPPRWWGPESTRVTLRVLIGMEEGDIEEEGGHRGEKKKERQRRRRQVCFSGERRGTGFGLAGSGA